MSLFRTIVLDGRIWPLAFVIRVLVATRRCRSQPPMDLDYPGEMAGARNNLEQIADVAPRPRDYRKDPSVDRVSNASSRHRIHNIVLRTTRSFIERVGGA